MCAAADHAPHPRRRGTLAPPYRRFINSVGDGVLDVPFAPHPVSRTRRAGVILLRCPKFWRRLAAVA